MVKVALAHDVLEDAPTPFADMVQDFLTDKEFRVVQALTKEPNQPVAEYYRGMVKQPVAVAIKVEDRLDNLNDMGSWSVGRQGRYLVETALHLVPLARAYDSRGLVELEQTTWRLANRLTEPVTYRPLLASTS